MTTRRKTKRRGTKKPTAKPKPAKKSKSPRPPRRPPVDPWAQWPHVAAAMAYCRDVIEGESVAGRLTVLACQRQLRDLERSAEASEAFPYVFDPERGERACRFIERLPHIKGPKAKTRELLVLEPWQCFFIVSIFGWVHRETGCRRFRKAFVEIARKNGKSFLASAIALYLTVADDEPGAEVYSAATSRDQAKIVWNVAKEIVNRSPQLQRHLGVHARAHSIVQTSSASVFVPLSSEDSNLDGLNPHGAVVDELHAHKTRGIYDVLETAMGARDQSLLFIITTAGDDKTGICYEVLEYVAGVLEESYADEAFFGLIYTIDDGDAWDDETVWPKANPNLGVSIDVETLRADARKAKQVPAAQAAFKTKRLNVWVGENAALFDFDAWRALGKPGLSIDDFEGKKCVVALDLARKNDYVARATLFFRRLTADELARVSPSSRASDAREKPSFFVSIFVDHYTNQGYVDSGKHPQLSGWVSEGWLKVNEGNTNDFHRVRDELLEDAVRFEMVEIGADPHQAHSTVQDLLAANLPAIEIAQDLKTMNEPTQKLEELIRLGLLEHDGNPVLAWEIGNVVGHYDAKERVYPRKDNPNKKIDGAIAIIMALSQLMLNVDNWTSVYEERGILTI